MFTKIYVQALIEATLCQGIARATQVRGKGLVRGVIQALIILQDLLSNTAFLVQWNTSMQEENRSEFR